MSTELGPLTNEEIRKYLGTENQNIIDCLYSLILSLYDGEGDRTKALDGKAATLFGFVGAFLSAIFIVLTFLGDAKNTKLAHLFSGHLLVGLITVLALLGASLIALFFAVVVKKGWKAAGDRDLFEAIHKYDGYADGDKNNGSKSDHDYKRHLTEHFWKLYRTAFQQNEAKAKALFWGQLFVFLGLLLLIAVQVTAMLRFPIDMTTTNSQNPTSTAGPSSTTPPAASTGSDGRPAPLSPSSDGAPARRDTGSRPVPLEASSAGENVRLGEGRLKPLAASSDGKPFRNAGDSRTPENKTPNGK